jgi:hypothetical protein
MKQLSSFILLCCLAAAPVLQAQTTAVPRGLAVGPDGTLYVAATHLGANGSQQLWLLAWDADGTPGGRFLAAADGSAARTLHLAGDTLLVTGSMRRGSGDHDMFAAAFDPATLVHVAATPTTPTFALAPGYPNPVTEEQAVVTFTMPYAAHIRIEVRSLTGAVVRVLTDEHRAAGEHRAVFSARDLPSGTYYIMLYSPEGLRMRKIALLR